MIDELARISHHPINRFSCLASYSVNNRIPYHLCELTLGQQKATADWPLGDTDAVCVPKGIGWLRNYFSNFNEENQDAEFAMNPNLYAIDKIL